MKTINAYLIFDGTCREAMTFYQECLGGELSTMAFGDGPFESPPEAKDRLIHARLVNGSAILMASDTMPGMEYTQGNSFSVSLACDSDDEVQRLYDALVAGGKPTMPPHDAFWGARFAMFTDRFGVNWMLDHEHPKQS
jgi:PhnB protein